MRSFASVAMTEEPKEGVIKFKIEHTLTQDDVFTPSAEFQQLSYWRNRFFLLKLIGQEKGRYDDASYGNVSCRIPPYSHRTNLNQFIITGTQTGKYSALTKRDYALVKQYHPSLNLLVSEGPTRPSAESMTHGMVYDECPFARWVFHAHSPEIWNEAARLGIPITDRSVGYGTPEMALEVRRLNQAGELEKRIFSMGGHEDGIITFGNTPEEAGHTMVSYLSRAKDF